MIIGQITGVNMINYKLIDDSISFYEDKGFKRIETPWLVT